MVQIQFRRLDKLKMWAILEQFHFNLLGEYTMIKKFLFDESGPAAVEYAVILALITVVALPMLTLLGDEVFRVYERIVHALQKVTR